MKIGLIVAIEMDAVFDYYKDVEKIESPKGFDVYCVKKGNREVYIANVGMGEIASAGGAQYLITKHNVDIIVNFGVVGGLTGEMKKHKICVVERVVHYRYDCTEFMDLKLGQVDGHDSIFLKTDKNLVEKAVGICPDLLKVTCCSTDKFVSKEEDKIRLHEEFEGDICEMEAAGIVLTCEANAVPCLMLKAVSDGLAGGADEFYSELKNAAFKCLEITDKIIEGL